MYLLDTNIMRKLLRGDPVVYNRFKTVSESVYVSSLVVGEVVGGYLTEIDKIMAGKSSNDLGAFSGYLTTVIRDLASLPLLEYDTVDEAHYREIKKSLGAKLTKTDGRIAGQA